MEKDKVLLELNKVFCQVFDDEDLRITEETTAADIEDWDSLEHINLIVACEKKFSMKFDISEIAKMKNVGDMAKMIMEKQ
ncbi:MAG: acyl carrier protein [Lachnospiraceae bacterium]|nr:acyl carrier protein [Lachnospiraceae bacterium]